MRKASVNGVDLHYVQQGEGTDVVLVHGMTGDLSFWLLTVAPQLAERHRVTVYDLRGHGYSDTPSGGYTACALARELVGLMDALGIRRAHVGGHSYGGTIALHAGLHNPERVRSLVLCEPSVNAQSQDPSSIEWLLRGEVEATAATYGLTIPDKLDMQGVLRLWPELRKVPIQHGIRRGQPRRMARLERLMTRTSMVADLQDQGDLELSTIRVPTLAVYGARSSWLTTRSFLEEQLPDCRSIVLSSIGHFDMTNFAGEFTEPVLEHFAAVESAERAGRSAAGPSAR